MAGHTCVNCKNGFMLLAVLVLIIDVVQPGIPGGGSCTGEHVMKTNPWAMASIARKKGLKFGQCGGEFQPVKIGPLISKLDMAAMKTAAVVTTQWLKQRLSSTARNHLRVLDSSWTFTKSGHEDFLRKHIPGAGFFDLNNCVTPKQTIPRNLPDPHCFEEYAELLGVKQDQHLVLYDQGGAAAAARAWWQFRAYGHPNVSVLEGGLYKWESEGNPVSSGGVLPEEKGKFKTRLQSQLMKTFEEVMADIKTKSSQILDARSPKHFKGEDQEPSPSTVTALEAAHLKVPSQMSRGHMPGAINFPISLILDPETGLFNTPDEIIENFQKMGVNLNRPVTTLCYNGNAASVLALGAALAGKDDAAVYYGSWTEFGQRASQSDCVLVSGQDRKSG